MDKSDIITIIRNDVTPSQVFQFQTVSSFSGNTTSTITTYPTTEGTPRADNIYINPTTFTVNVMIGGSENVNDEWGVGADRPINARETLRKLMMEAVPLTIVTPQGEYTNMFLTSISPSSTPQNAYNFSAGLSFSELFIATYQTIVAGPFNDAILAANDGTTQNNGSNDGSDWKDELKDIWWNENLSTGKNIAKIALAPNGAPKMVSQTLVWGLKKGISWLNGLFE